MMRGAMVNRLSTKTEREVFIPGEMEKDIKRRTKMHY